MTQAVMAPDSQPESTLERLIEENQVSLKRLCYLYLHDQSMAEDAVQETFLKAYRALKDFRGEASEKTYLTRIAINTCKDMLRTGWFRHVDRRVTAEELPSRQATDPYHREGAAAVMNLPRKYMEAVTLRYIQGYGVHETAEMLGITPSAVSRRCGRACILLKDRLEGSEDRNG